MQTIQGILLGLCFAGVLGGIVRLLSPGGSTERMLRVICVVFILAAVTAPMRSLVSITTAEPVQIQKDAAVDAVLRNAEEAMRQTAQNILEKYGYPNAAVTVTAQATDGQVHAGEFVITGVPAEKAQEIAHEIFSLTGEMPRMQTRAAGARGE